MSNTYHDLKAKFEKDFANQMQKLHDLHDTLDLLDEIAGGLHPDVSREVGVDTFLAPRISLYDVNDLKKESLPVIVQLRRRGFKYERNDKIPELGRFDFVFLDPNAQRVELQCYLKTNGACQFVKIRDKTVTIPVYDVRCNGEEVPDADPS